MSPSPKQIRNAINSSLRIRWILILTWIFSLQGLLFALLPLLINDSPGGMTYLMFDTSSFGLSAYNNSLSTDELHQSVKALVPSHITAPSSITQYLGVHDWYSVSYLWNCYGSCKPEMLPGGYDATPKLVVANCEHRKLNDTAEFSLRDLLGRNLTESVRKLLDEVPDTRYQSSIFAPLWLSGVCCAAFTFLFFPWTFRREKLLGTKNWCLLPTFLALATSTIFLTTLCVMEGQLTSSNYAFKATIGFKFRLLSILAVAYQLMTFFVGILGWAIGVWLQDSLPIKQPVEEDCEVEQYSDRPDIRTDELEELEPQPIDDDNDLPPEHTGERNGPGPSNEEVDRANRTGRTEDYIVDEPRVDTAMSSELRRISPEPIPAYESPEWQRSQFQKKLATYRRLQLGSRSL